jgi:hypothetical protein
VINLLGVIGPMDRSHFRVDTNSLEKGISFLNLRRLQESYSPMVGGRNEYWEQTCLLFFAN